MVNIKSIVQEISVASNPDATFRYGWKSFQNLKADKETVFPLHYLDTPIRSTIALKQSGLLERAYPITIFFGAKSKLDNTPEQHDIIIQLMYAESTKFIQEAQKNKKLHFVRDARETEVINIFDLNLSGIILEVLFIPFPNDNFC